MSSSKRHVKPPSETNPFQRYGTYFGDLTLQVHLASNLVSNVLGVFAGVNSKTRKLSVIINNKDTKPVSLYISNIPNGKFFMRHFGAASGAYKWQVRRLSIPFRVLNGSPQSTVTLKDSRFIVVPAYTAIFLLQQ